MPRQKYHKIVPIVGWYFIAFTIMLVFYIVGYALIQSLESNYDKADQFINYAGRQRMWSQRVPLITQTLAQANDADQATLITTLEDAIDEWETELDALINGNPTLNIPKFTDELLYEKLVRLQGTQATMIENALCIASNSCGDTLAFENLWIAQNIFLTDMNKLIFDFQSNVDDNKKFDNRLKLLLAITELFGFFIIGLFVIRPAIQRQEDAYQELQKSEADLQQSEARYRSVIDSVAEGIVLQNQGGVIVTANDAAEDVLGLTIDQMMGRTSIDPMWRSIHENGSPFPGETHPAMVTLQTGNAQRNVIMGVHKPDNSLTWISINSEPIFDSEDKTKPSAVVASFHNITEQKRLNLALQQQINLQSLLLSQLPDAAVIVFDNALHFQIVDGPYLRKAGYDRNAMLGKTLDDILTPEQLARLKPSYEKVLTGETISFAHEDDESGIFYVATMQPLLVDKIITGGLIVVRDTSTHVLAQRQLQENIQKLELSQAENLEFQQYLKSIHEIGAYLANCADLDCIYDYAVRAAREKLGFDRFAVLLRDNEKQILTGTYGTDGLGQHRQEFEYVDKIDAHHWTNKIDAMPNRTGAVDRTNIHHYHEKYDGGWNLASAIYHQDSSLGYVTTDNMIHQRDMRPYEQDLLTVYGNMIGYLVGLKQRESELAIAKDEAEAANRAKSTFLANMSHELRTPLNAILGFGQLLHADRSLTEGQKQQVKIIHKSGEHLLGLIDDVLDLSRIEAGQIDIHKGAFDLHQVLDETCQLLENRASDKGVRLIKDYVGLPQYIKADESKLRQIIINLLNNAIKFTKEGGIAFRAMCDDTNVLHIEIEDTGIGIDTTLLPQLFKPFSRGIGAENIDGSGLGLGISQHFVEMMGGTLDIRSILGTGTVVTITIPYELAQANQLSVLQDETEKIIGIAHNSEPYRILVVEDREENRRILTTLLKSVGFNVREAHNGQEGIRLTIDWNPHLIFMDMRMPIMDGYAATEQIIKIMGKEAPTIIGITASAFVQQHYRILEVGCVDVISKPFRTAEIFRQIQAYLNVEWVYEKPNGSMQQDEPSHLGDDIRTLAPDVINRLYKAVQVLDETQTLAIIDEIMEQNSSLATQLQQFIQSFRYDKIRLVIEDIVDE